MISNVNLQFFALFSLLIILANNHKILANTLYQKTNYLPESLLYENDQSKVIFEPENSSQESSDGEISPTELWSLILHRNHFFQPSDINLKRGLTQSIPFKKRKIPLELQKALYAHGIVGRRR